MSAAPCQDPSLAPRRGPLPIPSARALVLLCFFLSGATGLLYEVVWIRLFGFTLGSTHHSLTLVVAVFMGGLALGSHLGGRVADRSRNPLRLYGFLILGVGIICLAIPSLIRIVEPLFGWMYRLHDGAPDAWPLLLVRLAVSTLIILVPTTLMGATLPVLARHFTRSLRSVAWDFGRLYAFNTFGAVAGAFLTGAFGIPMLGLWGCILTAAFIDFGIASAVFVMSRGATHPEAAAAHAAEAHSPRGVTDSEAELEPPPAWDLRIPVLAFALSGFANMILQIAWTKALTGTIGNSTYAFTIIVTLFILGIGIGGMIAARLADRLHNIPLHLGRLLMVTAAYVLLTIPLLGVLPVWGAIVFARADPSFGPMLWRQAALVAVIVLPATTLMGMVFPVVGKWVTRHIESVGRSVGNAYFANTAGAILGTLTAGFILIPLVGRVHFVLYMASGITLATGVLVCLRFGRSWRSHAVHGIFAMVLLVPAFAMRPYGVLGSQNVYWHPSIHSLGVYQAYQAQVYAQDDAGFSEVADRLIEHNRILYFREGVHASVAVAELPGTGIVALRIAGKTEGSARSDGKTTSDMPTQLALAHLPVLFHSGPRSVATLGLGTGMTLGALTLYSVDEASREGAATDARGLYTIEAIDSLEISREVLEAVDKHFSPHNNDATRHPRVRHVLGDGRNHLLHTSKRYDVITSEPSNPWIAGIGNLFTKEFFEIVRDHLTSGGVFCQWLQGANLRREEFKMVLRTVLEVFPEHLLFWNYAHDCIMIASDQPLRFKPDRVRMALQDRRIAEELGVFGVSRPDQLVQSMRWTAPDIRRLVSGAPVNQDLYPYLEFTAPLGLHGHYLDAFEEILSHPLSDFSSVMEALDAPSFQRFELGRRGFDAYQHLSFLNDRKQPLDNASAERLRAVALSDNERAIDLSAALSPEHALLLWRILQGEKDLETALKTVEAARQSHGDLFDLLQAQGMTLAQLGRLDESVRVFDAALGRARTPAQSAMIHNDKGFAFEIHGRLEQAEAEYRAALKADPGFQKARDNIDRILNPQPR
ncbi:MAG: fused MFS/spermidine synthase [Planctomycetes bacterium]|nr:fused MFS/spermidine synthase [Planctomycetota bacterium]